MSHNYTDSAAIVCIATRNSLPDVSFTVNLPLDSSRPVYCRIESRILTKMSLLRLLVWPILILALLSIHFFDHGDATTTKRPVRKASVRHQLQQKSAAQGSPPNRQQQLPIPRPTRQASVGHQNRLASQSQVSTTQKSVPSRPTRKASVGHQMEQTKKESTKSGSKTSVKNHKVLRNMEKGGRHKGDENTEKVVDNVVRNHENSRRQKGNHRAGKSSKGSQSGDMTGEFKGAVAKNVQKGLKKGEANKENRKERKSIASTTDRSGYVYVVEEVRDSGKGDPNVKVGMSKNPKKRIQTLANINKAVYRVRDISPAANQREAEQAAHKALKGSSSDLVQKIGPRTESPEGKTEFFRAKGEAGIAHIVDTVHREVNDVNAKGDGGGAVQPRSTVAPYEVHPRGRGRPPKGDKGRSNNQNKGTKGQ